jgi:hypothetical protein
MRMQQQLTLAGGNRHAEPVARRGEKGKCRLHTRPGTGWNARTFAKFWRSLCASLRFHANTLNCLPEAAPPLPPASGLPALDVVL